MIGVYRRVMTWVGRLRRRFWVGFLLEIVIAVATAVPVFVAAHVLGQLVSATRGQVQMDNGLAWRSLVVIAACVVVRAVLKFLKDTVQESIGYERAAQTRLAVGDVLKRVPLGYFQLVGTGNILSAVTTNLNMIELEAVRQADAALGGYASALVVTLWLCATCPVAAVISCAAVALVSLTLKAINRAARRLTPSARTATERLSGAVVELYAGLGTAKSYGTSAETLAPFRNAVASLWDARIAIEHAFTSPATIHRIVLGVASTVLLVAAGAALLVGQMATWEFMAIALLSTTIFGPILRLVDAAHMLADIDDALDRIDAVLDAELIDESGHEVALERHDIEFDHVSFSYPRGAGEGQEVLRDVSLAIPEGTTCAIVGPSGSGKTTMASLMARFYDVDSGAVRVGKHDVREFGCDSLLRNFSMVFQDVYLFDDTVEANIAFGVPGATRDMVVEAARRARCHEFICALPEGYDTRVGAAGRSLSGGERQRISIARALLKDAPIVVLDEATASIDPENEQLVQQALSELMRGKTVIVIAHRLATIEHADQILVLDKGRITQRGTHGQLVSETGIYRDFVRVRAEAEGWRIGS